MKFYSLKISLEKGNYGSREQNEPGFDWEHPHSQGNLLYGFPDFEPIFSALLLGWGSKAVDFVEEGGAIGGHGLMLSPKAKEILLAHKLPEHRLYPIVHKHRKSFEVLGEYHWMQLLFERNWEWIDFAASSWEKTDFFRENGQTISFANQEAFEKCFEGLKKREERIVYKKLVLKKGAEVESMDLFYLGRIVNGLVISERLMQALKEAKVTGLLDFKMLSISF